MTQPRLIIAEDHALVAAGLRVMLEPTHEVVEVVANGMDVMAAVERLHPDLVLLDISLPGRSGMDVGRDLAALTPKVPFVMLTMHADPIYADEAIALGASGFVLKTAGPEELRFAIAQALEGRVYVTPRLTTAAEGDTAPEGLNPDSSLASLTRRQRQILRLIAKGWSLKDIADELGINVRSVEFHRNRIRQTLGLTSTAALVRYALAHGLVKR
ncbi:MAG TPA: response regulator transcription factor [Gemmatimonadales bacterium]|jgi:DNA-binding NarL/FixJ family response regulator|nr:response regulator transcription factor [Gemmatimonadales bacterium]